MRLTVRQRVWVGVWVLVLLMGIAAVWALDGQSSTADGAGGAQTTNAIGLPAGEVAIAVVAIAFWVGVAVYLVRRGRRRRAGPTK